MPSNSEMGLSHRFLWLFPKPLFGSFAALEEVDKAFTHEICKLLQIYSQKCIPISLWNMHVHVQW